jgi:hypothetical protein
LSHFKTFSLFYCPGLGFYVLRGDGTAPAQGETWNTIRFGHEADGSSYLTPAGANETLQCQRPEQQWPHKLLPNIYHAVPQTQDPRPGGLIGELPIFLGLAAMSMDTASLRTWLPWMFQGSRWHVHNLNLGCKHIMARLAVELGSDRVQGTLSEALWLMCTHVLPHGQEDPPRKT